MLQVGINGYTFKLYDKINATVVVALQHYSISLFPKCILGTVWTLLTLHHRHISYYMPILYTVPCSQCITLTTRLKQ